MSKEQLDRRALLIALLTQAGWENLSGKDEYNKDGYCDFKANLAYNKGPVKFELEYLAAQDVMGLYLSPDFPLDIALNIMPGDKLKEVITTLISVQDTISVDNFQTSIQRLSEACPGGVYLAKNGGIFRLVDGK